MPATISPIQMLHVEHLTPHPRNLRQHTTSQINSIAKSIGHFGFTSPILANESGTILAGHGRLLAAIQLGLTQVPVRTIKGLRDDEERAYLLQDNKQGDNSYFDISGLKVELLDLDSGALDLTLTGFSQAELADLLGTSKAAPEPPEEPQSELPVARLGDIWQLGENYLVVGKASKQDGDTICEDADKALKAWQKISKSKAILQASASNVVDSVIAEQSKFSL